MTGWNEDNFLERLLAQVRQQRGTERGSCPDAETICAVLEGEAQAPLREQVTEHLRHCPDCAELQNRLLNFDAGTSPEPEAVWKETRKRLDNWLEGFLRSEAANLRTAKSTAASRKGLRWQTFWSFFYSRKVAWGVGVAALLVLLADAVLVLELRREQPPQVQVAGRATVPPEAVRSATPVPEPPEKSTEKPKIMPQEEGLPKAGNNFPSRAASPNRPKAGEPMESAAPPGPIPAPANHNLPSQITRATPPPPPNLALPSFPPDHNLPTETAQATVPSPPNPTVRAVARPTAPAIPRPMGSYPTYSPPRAQPSLPRNAASEAPTSHPPRLWLDPAGRVLIVLSSISRKPDGSFQFHGILLLPVAQPGPVPLDRGAEVVGAGTMSQGQTSLAVTELVVQGARYTLKDGTGAMKAQTPGAGGAVQFDRSQVLEMWPASPSVYEKAPDTTVQPEPQK